MLDSITPVILTFNEEANLDRTLQGLTWARRIVIVDSYSSDRTQEIAAAYPQVDFIQRSFDTHGNQWNYAIEQVKTEWALSLDADYTLTDELVEEMAALDLDAPIDSYFIPFKYCVFGKPLRGTLLPPREALFRRDYALYIDDGHTQLLTVKGTSARLKTPLLHDDRKTLNRWLWAQDRYMALEVKKLLSTPKAELSIGDRIRKSKILAPPIILIYCLILKGGILDGWAGWYYALQRVLAEILLSIHLIQAERMTQQQ